MLDLPAIKASAKAIARLPHGVNAHFVRESARAVRVHAATLEVAAVSAGNWTETLAAYALLKNEVRAMAARLNLEED